MPDPETRQLRENVAVLKSQVDDIRTDDLPRIRKQLETNRRDAEARIDESHDGLKEEINDVRGEVRGLRTAMWGLAASLLVAAFTFALTVVFSGG